MANTTAQDVISQWQVYFAALPGVRAAPGYLPDGKLETPFIVCYVGSAVWTILEVDQANNNAILQGVHSLVVELHCNFASLTKADEEAMRYSDQIPNMLANKYLFDNRWNSTIQYQGNAFPGATGLTINQDRPGSLGWAGQDTWGIRWTITGLVFRSLVPA